MAHPGTELHPARFSTRDLPPSEQFAAWSEHYASTFALALETPTKEPFPADHLAWSLGPLTFTRASMPDGIRRRWQHVPHSSRDHWMLVLAPQNRTAILPGTSGHLGVRSLGRPFEGRGGDGEVLTLFLPRDPFARQAPAFDRAPEALARTGMAALVADVLITLDQNLAATSPKERDRIAHSIMALVRCLLAPSADQFAEAAQPMNDALFERARRLIRQNLDRPAFDPEALWRALFISRSRLYRLFESHGGVANFIQLERMQEARRVLEDISTDIPIGELAHRLGFPDHSSFSRAFRRVHGLSPRDCREAALIRRP